MAPSARAPTFRLVWTGCSASGRAGGFFGLARTPTGPVPTGSRPSAVDVAVAA